MTSLLMKVRTLSVQGCHPERHVGTLASWDILKKEALIGGNW